MKRLPPIGMCGEVPDVKIHSYPLLATTDYEKPQKTGGSLSAHLNPVIPVRFLKNGNKTDWFNAMIDTGSFYSLAKENIFRSLGIESIGTTFAEHIEDGNMPFNMYPCAFKISDLKIGFSTTFLKLHETFQYDVVLGSHIFDISELHIYGAKKLFELIF